MPNAPRPPAAAVQSGPAGAKLSPDQITQEFTSLGYAPGGASGWAQNVMRESGGDPRNVGDNGTSHGLFQHHNERWDQLQAFAKEKGGDPYDPMMQIQFTDHEMQTQYPKLRAKLMDPNTSGAEGEEMIRRVFERPAAGGYGQDPKIRTDKFNFSDDALREHESDPDTDVVYMSPQDYLDLTPALGNSPKEQRDAASIRKSVAAGDSIDEIPSLNIQTGSKGSAVFGQDGRNRALLAQENGLDLIPVAIHREGDVKNPITEIEGMTGKILPYNYDKVPPPPPAKPGMLKSALMGAGEGFGKTVLGGQQLVGKALEAIAPAGSSVESAGKWLSEDAERGVKKIEGEVKPAEAAHPWAAGIGELAGSTAIPGGIAGKATRLGVMGAGALAGGVGALLEPVAPGAGYGAKKAEQVGIGTAAGGIIGAGANKLAAMAAPKLSPAVKMLMGEGVELTPGQMAGGAAKVTEDKAMSLPITGDVINAARRRSVETFNRAAINRALGDLPTIPTVEKALPKGLMAGHDAIEFARKTFNTAYQAVTPKMKGEIDPAFSAKLANLEAKAASELPKKEARQMQSIIKSVRDKFAGGTLDGTEVQEIGTDLDNLIKPMSQNESPYVQDLGRRVRDLDRSLDTMMADKNPALQAQKDAIDNGYAKFKIIQDAAAKQGTKEGVFTPSHLSQAVRERDKTKDKRAFSEGAALLQDLSNAAKSILPSEVRDSGTAGRLFLGGGGLVGAAMHPLTAAGAVAGLGAAALPYTAKGTRLTNALVSRLAQPAGPVRNALIAATRKAPLVIAPAAGRGASNMIANPSQANQ
jgi:hypothetical protein